ncbi:hypothetical protein QQP08_012817 [Theobroma cacao]|nr:hypothetical protein QQP08_012817 [Theobroma cacao]
MQGILSLHKLITIEGRVAQQSYHLQCANDCGDFSSLFYGFLSARKAIRQFELTNTADNKSGYESIDVEPSEKDASLLVRIHYELDILSSIVHRVREVSGTGTESRRTIHSSKRTESDQNSMNRDAGGFWC